MFYKRKNDRLGQGTCHFPLFLSPGVWPGEHVATGGGPSFGLEARLTSQEGSVRPGFCAFSVLPVSWAWAFWCEPSPVCRWPCPGGTPLPCGALGLWGSWDWRGWEPPWGPVGERAGLGRRRDYCLLHMDI